MSTANVLEPATLNKLNPSPDMVFVASVTVGESRSYYFRQNLNTAPSSSPKYNPPKQIIPSIPRQRIKAPTNSFLSPIRSEKAPPRRSSASSGVTSTSSAKSPPPLLMSSPLSTQQLIRKQPSLMIPSQPEPSQVQKPKRPYPLIHAISSPASIFPLKMNRRRRKVSFSEHVVVVRTIIHTDEDDIEEEKGNDEEEDDDESLCIYDVFRRHSTGSAPTTSSDDIENNEVAKQQILGVSKSLQRFVF